jgi:hypothetical protein
MCGVVDKCPQHSFGDAPDQGAFAFKPGESGGDEFVYVYDFHVGDGG